MLRQLIKQLTLPVHLSEDQVREAVSALIDEKYPPETKADFLSALAQKGETPEEIAAFARELRSKAIQPVLDAETRKREILDVCGTGGDQLHTFNISTTVAIVAASAGITVAKHGNRAITSQAGSADVLEALGMRIDLTPEQAVHGLRDHNFAFFFAQKYHPSFKHIAPARKICAERKQRTIFNFLGPLLNPVGPTAQLVGVPRPELCEPIGRVLQSLGVRRGMVVCGQTSQGFLDELSILGPNTIAEFYQDRGFSTSLLSTEAFAFAPATLDDLLGGDPQANAQTISRLLNGAERGPKRDALLLNAAAALFVAGKAKSLLEGSELASNLIDSGLAREKLKELTQDFPQ